jgi:amino acid permease
MKPDVQNGKDDSAYAPKAVDTELGATSNPLERGSYGKHFPVRDLEEHDDDGHVKRTGSMWTAAAHIITGVIGAGVLSLAWASAQVGWLAAVLLLFMFAWITWYCSRMLANAYRWPTKDGPNRNYTYMDAVRHYLSPQMVFWCGLFQYANLIGTGIGYSVTSGLAATSIRVGNCVHYQGGDPSTANCCITNNPWILGFGAFQLVLSQVPDFDRLWIVSIFAAIMSFSYSSIGIGLEIGKMTEIPNHETGTLSGITNAEAGQATKVWDVFNGLGSFAFAYSFSLILIEIQDTLKAPADQPNSERRPMKKAAALAIGTTTAFYGCAALFGYAAFGDMAPGNLLTGITSGGFVNPYWLINLANAMVFAHLVGAYQVYTQPWFAFVEATTARWFPTSYIVHKEYALRFPGGYVWYFNWFRFTWRTLYVCFTTVVAMLLPFFNDILGFLGAIGFWPLTVWFPVQLNIAQNKIPMWSGRWIWLQSLSFFCFLISLAAAIGSIAYVVDDLKSYTAFGSHSGTC